jgi:hypothetical protein
MAAPLWRPPLNALLALLFLCLTVSAAWAQGHVVIDAASTGGINFGDALTSGGVVGTTLGAFLFTMGRWLIGATRKMAGEIVDDAAEKFAAQLTERLGVPIDNLARAIEHAQRG